MRSRVIKGVAFGTQSGAERFAFGVGAREDTHMSARDGRLACALALAI